MRLQQVLVDRYRLERELGRGGMATVYLAEDLKHHRQVAVKVLLPELAHAVGAERFLQEIEIAARLAHPGILPLYDSGGSDGILYYVMPYIEGESLGQRLERERQLPVEEAIRIACEISDALGYAHGLGLVHRDIKPDNILFQAGHALVSDFGIARAVGRASHDRLTRTGLAMGTAAYMSPEQATGEIDVDARSDIYSLACVVYEMLAGTPPYVAASPQAILARKALEPVPGLRVVRDTVPVTVERALTRALSKNAVDRFPTTRAFAEALSDSGSAADTAARGRSRAGKRVAWAAALVGLIAGASYLVVAVRSARGSHPVVIAATRLTAAPGVEWFPSLSPDAKWVTYSGDTEGNRDIYLLSIGGRNPINLTKDAPEDDDQPAFSPDGELIAFRSNRDGGGIFVMGRTGDGLRRVTRFGYRPAWSPDGGRIAFVTESVDLNPQNFLGQSELFLTDVTTGQARRIYDGDAAMPSWSPHGRRIAFTTRGAGVQVWTVSADGKEPLAVTSGVGRNWNPAWSPDGRYLYFVSDRRGSMNLWRVRIDEASGRISGEPEPITTPATSLAHISLSADGRHVAYATVTVTSNIQRATFDPARGEVLGDPVWLTTGSQRWANPEPSPDGQMVALYSLVEPEGDIYLMRSDGSGLRRITGDTAVDRLPRWSPDGNWIAFFSDRGGRLQVWKIHPDGSGLRRVADATAELSVWSPDGQRMVIGSVAQRGAAYVVDPDAQPSEQQPVALPQPPDSMGPFGPYAWSPDGEYLSGMVRLLDIGVVIYSFRSRAYQRLTEFGQWPIWLPDSRHLLFVSHGKSLYIVDRRTRQVRQVLSAGPDIFGPPQLTRDGRSLYFMRRVTEADVWLVTLR